jgi:hypothetical protein
MKQATITLKFTCCLDGCPYADLTGIHDALIYCLEEGRPVVGYTEGSDERVDKVVPTWCPVPDIEGAPEDPA